MAIQRLVRQLPVPDKVVEAILKLARSARPGTGAGADTDRLIAWGPGPRASQALMLAVRAKALIDGRLAPSVDDVIALAEPVLKHRMALTFAARAEGETASGVINRSGSGIWSNAGWRQRKAPRRHRPQAGQSSVFKLEGEAHALADRLPELMLDALHVANTVAHGIHGRRRAGHGRDLLAVPPVPGERPGHRHRLAPLGQLRPPLRARARMGGGAHLLAVARHLAVHGLPQPPGAHLQARPRAGADAGHGRAAGARRRAHRAHGADAADGEPQGHLAHRRDAGRPRGRRRGADEPAAAGAA